MTDGRQKLMQLYSLNETKTCQDRNMNTTHFS